MATATTQYLGKLRCSNLHLQSGTEIFTDAPTDNQGMGSAFSPTDLCALSLTTCIVTTMGIYAKSNGFEILSIEADTTKQMGVDPRRIEKISALIQIKLSADASDRQKEGLQRITHICPVSRSLHPELIQDIVLQFIE